MSTNRFEGTESAVDGATATIVVVIVVDDDGGGDVGSTKLPDNRSASVARAGHVLL